MTPCATIRILTIPLIAAAVLMWSVASRLDAAPAKTGLHVTILYFAGASTTPSSDAQPVVLEAVPIELTPTAMRSIEPGSSGRFTVRVDGTGTVHDLTFHSTASPGPLARPLRHALAQWRFAPFTKDGRPQSIQLPLAYVASSAAMAADDAAKHVPAPVPLFRIQPSLTPSLCRRKTAMRQPYFMPDRQQVVTTVVQGPNGQMRTIVQRETIRQPGHLEFPTAIDRVEPAAWMRGSVDLSFEIDASGAPGAFTVHGSTCAQLEPEVVAALRSSRFLPPTIDGKAVRSRIRDRVVFPAEKDLHTPSFVHPAENVRWDQPPEITGYALPVFPTEILAAKVEGKARVRVHLDESGLLQGVDLLETNREEFAHAMRAAMYATSWAPARRKGAPIACAFDIEARFTLKPQDMDFGERQLPAALLAYTGPSKPLTTETLDSKPRLLTGRQPRTAGVRTTGDTTLAATLEITIDPTGRVRDPMVVSATNPACGYAAVQAASTWLFEPPTRDGIPVATRVRVPLTLREPGPDGS